MREAEKYRATVYLEREAVEIVREFLEKNGQSFSGWMNAMVVEFAKEIKGQPSPFNKPIEEMTIKEFGEVASYWFKKARGSDEAEESGPTS